MTEASGRVQCGAIAAVAIPVLFLITADSVLFFRGVGPFAAYGGRLPLHRDDSEDTKGDNHLDGSQH